MSYIVFARKYRPQILDEVVGQDHVVQTLKNAIKEGRVAQSYLFVGSRGVGKTSTARILAKILNCLQRKEKDIEPCNICDSCREIAEGTSFDVLEIDGASNRRIDEIRNLRENVKFKPTYGKYKIYIIDEVHMLTTEAFNALLKTLEEPPAHVKFIFATTEPHLVLPTIVSRCQRFNFRRIPTRVIAETIKNIAKKEKIKAKEEIAFTIAKSAGGSLRDAESVLDQLASYSNGNITIEATEEVLGVTKEETYLALVDALERKDSQKVLTILQGVIKEGKDLRQFNKGLLQFFRDILMTKTTKSPEKMIERLPESIKELQKKGTLFTVEDLLYIITILQNLLNQIRYASSPQIYTEIALVKLTSRENMVPLEMLIDRLDGLKKQNDKGDIISNTMNMPSLHSRQERESSQYKDIEGPEERIQQKVEGYLKTQHKPDKIDVSIKKNEQKQTKSITLTMIEEQWTNILNEVKKKRMSLGVFLSEAEPIDVEGDVLVVGFPNEFAFHKETVETIDNKRSVEAAIENVMKTPLRVSYVVTKKDVREEVLDTVLDNGHHSKIVESAVNIFHGKPVRKRS